MTKKELLDKLVADGFVTQKVKTYYVQAESPEEAERLAIEMARKAYPGLLHAETLAVTKEDEADN